MNMRSIVTSLVLLHSSLILVLAQSTTVPPPSQPSRTDAPLGHFEIVGDSIVSGQQLFLGTQNKVYIVDKTEGNPTQINGHPAWAAEYDIETNQGRPMDVVTNSFCAGGSVLGNGTWMNVGGNQAITYGGVTASSQTGGAPYDDPDGGKSMRLLNPCDDGQCNWSLTADMSSRRWYPAVETLEDGSAIILGGCEYGGFVNDASQTNPTYEFFPSEKGATPITSPLLSRTLPVNLYPLTWMLPSGKLLVQSNWETVLLDHHAQQEYRLDNMLDAVRTYPASAGTAMLPLTPANNWTATVLFCGGQNLQSNQWGKDTNLAALRASTSCVTITPDISSSYVQDDPLPEGRVMGSLVLLPDGRILCMNGGGKGVAGYGTESWAIGQSYADDPVLMPAIYTPGAPAGQRWSRDGLSASTIPRLYHSSALLLPDGSVIAAGSNPNADYNVGPKVQYPTELTVERFYPSYYNMKRPQPVGILSQLSYGGSYFNISLSAEDLSGDVENVQNVRVVVLRPGFSTHAMAMGQRFIELEHTYTGNADGSAVLHTSQIPPNPAIFQPGPALFFVVVNGIPSVGVQIMVGSGAIETQNTLAIAPLPASSFLLTKETYVGPGSTVNRRQSSDARLAEARWLPMGMAILMVIVLI